MCDVVEKVYLMYQFIQWFKSPDFYSELLDTFDITLRSFHHTNCTSSMHYNDVIMSAMASQITSLTLVHSTVYSRCRLNKTLKLRVTGLCGGSHQSPMNCLHKGPVTRKMFPFHDVNMGLLNATIRRPMLLKQLSCVEWMWSEGVFDTFHSHVLLIKTDIALLAEKPW